MLAYFDSFAGLVPCRIVAVGDWSDNNSLVRVQYTASRGFTTTRGAFKRGQYDTWPLNRIVPRSAIRRRKYGTRIAAYDWPAIVARCSATCNPMT